ncbi:unnamed protein product [Rhodiola kirilowii]
MKIKHEATLMVMMMIILGIFIEVQKCDGKVVQFIFGDSLSEVGNNARLPKSLAKASLPWYGIDFGNGIPTGRFCNGRTVADIFGDEMGFPRPPPLLDPDLTEDTILANGVNYASGGGGILNETGTLFIQRFSLWKQIELFEGTQKMIRAKIGEAEADNFFQQSRYIVASGSNDFINNYLFPVYYNDSRKYNDKQFIKYISKTFEMQLRALYKLGARQVMVFGLGPLGCIPLRRVLSISGECQYKANVLSQKFNEAGIKLLKNLSKQLPNSSFIFGNVYDIVYDMVSNPEKHGFNNSNAPCCTFGGIRPAITCTPLSTLCKDRGKYVFWDEYHPTDRANEIVANELLSKLGLVSKSNISEITSPAPALAPSLH